MSRLPKSFGFFALTAGLLSPQLVAAQPSDLPIPDGAQVDEFHDKLNFDAADFSVAASRGDASARECTLDPSGVLACHELRSDTFCAGRWSEGPDAKSVSFAGSGGTWWAREAIGTDVGIVLQDVSWRSDDGRLVTASAAMLADGRLELQSPRWFQTSELDRGPCPSPPTPGEPHGRAETATYDGTDWKISALHIAPWPLGSPTKPELGSSGLLPPTLRARDLAVEAQAYYWFAPFLAVTALADTTGRVGGGATLITARRGARKGLDLAAVYTPDERALHPVVAGDVAVGEQQHLRGHFEHPIDEQSWRYRRLEHGALFREWRLTNAGVSLAGAGHALSGNLTYLTDPALLDPELAGSLGYATRFDAQLTDWNVQLDHESTRDEDTRHSSTVAVDFGVPLGSRGSAFMRPGLGVVGNYGTVTATRGFDASTTLSVLGTLETSIALEGRFAHTRHRLTPRLRVGGELLGIQQRQAEEGAPPYPYTRPEAWRYASLIVDQTLEQAGWTFSMPVGAYGETVAELPFSNLVNAARPHAAVGIANQGSSLQLRVVCSELCEAAQFGGVARVQIRDGLSVYYGLADIDASALRVAFADSLLGATATSVELVQELPEFDGGIAHDAGVELRRGPLAANVSGRWDADSDAARGVTARVSWAWPTLGWGIGASAGARADGEWLASLGLTLN